MSEFAWAGLAIAAIAALSAITIVGMILAFLRHLVDSGKDTKVLTDAAPVVRELGKIVRPWLGGLTALAQVFRRTPKQEDANANGGEPSA
ncbi:hypothetical protein ACFVYA_35205 [Amycolatopsis sp. NPDC058278]|uniref:hypothetical protein n=1 Tax=Amycolatopsis sp. NPDC058278 TaxID=3346417 RepID=UPI0036D89303